MSAKNLLMMTIEVPLVLYSDEPMTDQDVVQCSDYMAQILSDGGSVGVRGCFRGELLRHALEQALSGLVHRQLFGVSVHISTDPDDWENRTEQVTVGVKRA